MKKSYLATVLSIAVCAFSSAANAAVLVQYDFETTPGGSTFTTATTSNTMGVTGSAMGGDLTGSTFASDTTQRSAFAFTDTTTISTASTTFWDFTVTSATRLNLTDLRFAIGRAGATATTAIYNVSSSVDNHATLLNGTNFSYSADNDAMSAPGNQVTSLAASAFQNLDASAGINFRIYYADSSTAASTGARIDTVILNGDVVPEPSSLALGLLGALSLLGIRRR